LNNGCTSDRSQDTAEYGLGMALGSQQRRERLVADVRELLGEVRGMRGCADRNGDVFFYFLG
jgi:hypothetical protein